ncbi:hypothetical protein CNMCM6106_004566 [Aspergillus hiratsukae]|uniref:DNA/RNA-binding domain-containing protein n=1 Tax=Aspergillus hiratsukae TaxID=1194566 RepID=A0A8H6UM45_9EURO|nr:hypothetical protein CNMCM6106_004566 [Aspergillus hiratsukae]
MSNGFTYQQSGIVPNHPNVHFSSKDHAADQLGAQSIDSPKFSNKSGDFPKRSIGRLPADNGSPVASPVSHLARHSVSPPTSVKRPYSAGAMPENSDSEALSNQGFASGGSVEAASAHSIKDRQQKPKTRQRHSAQMLGPSGSRIAGKIGNRKSSQSKSDTRLPRRSAYSADDLSGRWRQDVSQPDAPQMRASPVQHESVSTIRPGVRQGNLAARPKGQPAEPVEGLSFDQKSAGGDSAVAGGTASHGIFLQPETHPITEEQLINEVRGIYAGLVMVEKKCIEIDKQQSESKTALSPLQWQALIALHRTLLNEHHDFFLASQHPSASPVLKRLAEKYAMPAQSVRAFEETWIECLGDLARYRMAVEEVDLRDREVWAGVARYWYNKAADKNPDVGRIQHHLAVLARPDIVQQLFYYTKSLVSVHSFPSTRESIPSLFNPLLHAPKAQHHYPLLAAFVLAHGYLFCRNPGPQFCRSVREFLADLDTHVGRMGAAFKMQGVYISSCNFAAIFEYNHPDAPLPAKFYPGGIHQERSSSETQLTSAKPPIPTGDLNPTEAEPMASEDGRRYSPLSLYACCLTFQTLSVLVDQIGNKNIYPTVHISLAFLWCLVINGKSSIEYIEAFVPWRKVTTFLNTMIRDDTDSRIFEGPHFPTVEERKQLPEDFFIRGQLWSQLYFPPHFFEDSLIEDEGRFIELPSLNVSRMYRCLWLGVQIATCDRWMTYDSVSRKFSVTPFALGLEEIAAQHNRFQVAAPQPGARDLVMHDT